MHWQEIHGWFQWRTGQEEAVGHFPAGSRFVEVGTYLGRSLCSLGEVVRQSGKAITVVGVDTCRGSGPEGPRQKDFHGEVVAANGGTFAGVLHRNILEFGYGDLISLVVADSVTASRFFADRSLAWVHLDARHDDRGLREDIAAWLPKLRSGGWLSGDDYDEVKWPEVVRVVAELFPSARPWSTQQWRYQLP